MGPKSNPGEGVYRYEGASKSLVYVNQYYEKNLSTQEVTTHYYLGGKEIAFRKGSTLEYLHTDHLGSTSVTTNTSGAQVSKVAYFPFGGARSQTGVLDTDKRFTGQRLDQTGLYYYNARYYDATLGRFISPDTIVPNPANPQSLNRYSYCLNNPLRYVDPSGRWEVPSIATILAYVAQQQAAANQAITQAQQQRAAPAPPVSKATPIMPSGVTAVTIVPLVSSGAPAMANVVENTGTAILILAGVCYLAYETTEACKNVAGDAGGSIGIPKDVTDKIVEGVEMGFPIWYGLEKLGGYLFGSSSGNDTIQKGGNIVKPGTAEKLNEYSGQNLPPREWGRALERLKGCNGVPGNDHGKIKRNGDYQDSREPVAQTPSYR